MAQISDHDEVSRNDAQHGKESLVTGRTGAEVLSQTLRNEKAKVGINQECSMNAKDAFKLYSKAVMFSFIFSLAVIMEGYDVSLMTNFYAYPAFKNRYGDQVDPKGGLLISAKWQSILSNSVHVGQVIGLYLNGYAATKFGYRKTMMVSMLFLIGLIFIPFFSNNLQTFLVGAILQGIPWGVFQTLSVTYASDILPVSLRGYLTTSVNMCWVIGQFISAGVLRALVQRNDEWAYRIPFAIQWVWIVPILVGCWLAPESPWWLVRQGRFEEAKSALLLLTSRNCGVAFDADAQLELIKATDKLENEMNASAGYLDCFKGVNLRRTEITVFTWLTQVFCGSAFMGYGTQFYQRAGLRNSASFSMALGQNALGLLGTILSWLLITKYGRRTLYLGGIVALFILLMIIGFCGIAPVSNTSIPWAVGTMLIVFMGVYDSTIGPVCYAIVGDIPSTRMKVKTVSLARNAYVIGGFINNSLMPRMIGLNSWNWGAYIGFFWGGVCGLLWLWCFFRLPESKGRSYAEMDLLFERKVSARRFASTNVNLVVDNDIGLAMSSAKDQIEFDHVERKSSCKLATELPKPTH